MRILLITPPMTQLNTPYPATAYLKGTLSKRFPQYVFLQSDLSIQLFHRIFSEKFLIQVKENIKTKNNKYIQNQSVTYFIENFEEIIQTLKKVIPFLKGEDSSLAYQLSKYEQFPVGPKFKVALESMLEHNYLDFAFGTMGIQDRAKYFSTLFIEDISELITSTIDHNFSLSRYAEKISASQSNFAIIEKNIFSESLVTIELNELVHEQILKLNPDLVVLTVPFPGNLMGALKIANVIKENHPHIKVAMGGGYVNTELRALEDTVIFKYVDYISLDDGELPLIRIIQNQKDENVKLVRTFILKNNQICFENDLTESNISFDQLGTPTYSGLDLSLYVSVLENLNPMHRLWSDTRWNKITVAHGCYWKKCNFCDVGLDYISRFEKAPAKLIVDRMVEIQKDTGVSGFHFVDEAAPPAVLKEIAIEIINRKLNFSWWGNIRFDKTFTKELTSLLAQSGCIAVTGGIEVASERLLKLMNKGVTIQQVAKVTKAFNDAGILVHSYLMYGFPTQTVQETIDSLEVVRQLFKNGCLDSAFWHRFSATIHSPIGKNPEKFGIQILPQVIESKKFAENDLQFFDPTGVDHDEMGRGLNKALYNYMLGIGLDEDVRVWFESGMPKTTHSKKVIQNALLQLEVERFQEIPNH